GLRVLRRVDVLRARRPRFARVLRGGAGAGARQPGARLGVRGGRVRAHVVRFRPRTITGRPGPARHLAGPTLMTASRRVRPGGLQHRGEVAMPILLLSEDDVRRLLTMEVALEAVETGLRKQARTQVLAVCRVRPVQRVHVYSRSEENRRRFAAELSAECGVAVEPVERPELAARGQDVVITATTSREPVLHGEWLSDGTHLN